MSSTKKKGIADFKGIKIRVLTRDEHCDPHVHAFHEAAGWEVKIFFSFASVKIGPVEPEAGKFPSSSVVQECMNSVTDKLDECRRQFWDAVKKVCFENQFVSVDSKGILREAEAGSPGALKVSRAEYIASTGTVEFEIHGKAGKHRAICP